MQARRNQVKQIASAPLPANEAQRLAALNLYAVGGNAPDALFDEFTRLAAEVCATPMAMLSIVKADRVSYPSLFGVSAFETARADSFCAWTILDSEVLIVPDALHDTRFNTAPFVRNNPGLRFYAGAPLLTPDGQALGALAVMDIHPRQLTAAQARSLRTLAAAVVTQLELRRQNIELARATVRQQQTLDELAASEERYALVARSANDGLWDWNLETNEMHLCPRWKAMLGYTDDEISNRPDEWFKRVHPEDVELLHAEITSHLLGATPHFQKEHRLKKCDGTYRWVLTRGLAVWDSKRAIYRMAGSITDITEQKQAEQRLLHDAFHDVLTGLPNRALFMDRLARSLERAKNRGTYLFAVLFLDLDRFKVVNDSLGHQVGDQLLVAIARRLEVCLRPGDMVARMGGDEFAIILDHLKNIGDATQAADRIHKELAQPFTLSGHEVFASVSVGIAHSLTPYDKAEDFIRNADTAMYRAKDQGRGRSELFDKGMHAHAVALLELETDLRRALSRNEFRVFYQPIVSLEDWHIAGFEALVRWEHPQQGFISPMKFVPVAEETGLILPIGQWVLREACSQLRTWQEQYPSQPPLTMSVNLSGKQFLQSDLIKHIEQVLTDTGLDASSLKIEITESAIIENIESAAESLRQLKRLGIRISLDDFGTGYSSLSYLHRFPIDTLKIDRSFVMRMDLPKNSEIVRTIINLAVNLGMDVIAEGVETREQIIQLTGLGCSYIQGYLLSKPVDGKAIETLIEETRRNSMSAPPPTATPAFSIPADIVKGLVLHNTTQAPPVPFAEPEETTEAAILVETETADYSIFEDESEFSPMDEDEAQVTDPKEQKKAYSEFSGKAKGDNRRRSERFRLGIPTRVIGYDRKAGKWDEVTQTVDVSKTGVTLQVHKRVRHGNVLHLTLPLPVKLRSHGYYDSTYRVYAIVRRIEPARNGESLIGLEFIGEQAPAAYLERPWAVYHSKKWAGSERRREPRIEKPVIVNIEYLSDKLRTIGHDTVLAENHSRGGMRLRMQSQPPDFYVIKVIGPAPAGERFGTVRNRYIGVDNCERLCLRFMSKKELSELA